MYSEVVLSGVRTGGRGIEVDNDEERPLPTLSTIKERLTSSSSRIDAFRSGEVTLSASPTSHCAAEKFNSGTRIGMDDDEHDARQTDVDGTKSASCVLSGSIIITGDGPP